MKRVKIWSVVVGMIGLVAGLGQADAATQKGYRSFDDDSSDYLGFSVSVHGERMIVGAPGDDEKASQAGAAYVFEYDNVLGEWVEAAKLMAPVGLAKDSCGYAVHIRDSLAIVGCPTLWTGDPASNGKAHVYEFNGTSWNHLAELTSDDPHQNDGFGHSVAIGHGEVAFVGAPLWRPQGLSQSVGQVTMFLRNSFGWVTASEHTGDQLESQYGFSMAYTEVADNEGRLIVGAPKADVDGLTNAGHAKIYCLYDPPGSMLWEMNLKDTVTGSDANGHANYGWAVDIQKNTAIVGAPYTDNTHVNQGSAAIFERSPSGGACDAGCLRDWYETDLLIAPDPHQGDFFGASVAISDKYYNDLVVVAPRHAVVGAPNFDGYTWVLEGFTYKRVKRSNTGKVYTFNEGTGWSHGGSYERPVWMGKSANEYYGWSVDAQEDPDDVLEYDAFTGAPYVKPGGIFYWIDDI